MFGCCSRRITWISSANMRANSGDWASSPRIVFTTQVAGPGPAMPGGRSAR